MPRTSIITVSPPPVTPQTRSTVSKRFPGSPQGLMFWAPTFRLDNLRCFVALGLGHRATIWSGSTQSSRYLTRLESRWMHNQVALLNLFAPDKAWGAAPVEFGHVFGASAQTKRAAIAIPDARAANDNVTASAIVDGATLGAA